MEVIYQVNNLKNNLALMVHTCKECDTRFTPKKEMGWDQNASYMFQDSEDRMQMNKVEKTCK